MANDDDRLRRPLLTFALACLAVAIAALALGGPPSSPIVRERRATGVVTAVSLRTRLDKRLVAGDVTVRLDDAVVRLRPHGFPRLDRGDRVVVLERTHEDGRRTFTLLERIPQQRGGPPARR